MTNIAFVHAHPDDETIATGALIAHLVRIGHDVSVLTATRGELGEVVPGPLSHLAGTPELEVRRERELAGALVVLGVTRHAFLGAPGARADGEPRRYLDSGMRWISDGVAGPGEDSDERSLCSADESEVTADIAAWLRNSGAELVITYDADGGYGHPDHIRCHHATRAAAEQLGLDFAVVVHEPGDGVRWFDLGHLLPVVAEALGHHATQVSVSGSMLTHSGGQSEPVITAVGLRGELGRLDAHQPTYRHVFWDMGGTMVDTYPALDAALAGVVRAAGHAVDEHDVAVLTRVSTGRAMDVLSERFGIPVPDFEVAEAELKLRWESDPAPAMPGLSEVMAAVPGLNLVVTHRDRASATSLLNGLGITVDDLISTDDGFPRKPDPAMYTELARRHGLDVADCVAVGDRSIDAEAAAAAGMATVMLTTPGIPTRVHGDHCVEHLTQLLGLLAH